MTDFPKPEVILTHESDLDGFVSGVLLQRLATKMFDSVPRLEAWNYNAWAKRTLSEKSAWICDLSFEPRMDRADWVICDHHITEAKATHARFIHDTTKSASLICYDLCREQGLGSEPLDRLVRLTDIGDLFKENDPDFLTACDYGSLVKVYGFWNLHALIGGELERLLDHPLLEVMIVKRRVEDPMGYDWSRPNIRPLSPEVGLVETVVGNPNAIIHRLLNEKATSHAVLLTLSARANRTFSVSLRSQNGEALVVARQLQGGGHPNACGATLPKSIQSDADAIDYLKHILSNKSSQAGLSSLADAFKGL